MWQVVQTFIGAGLSTALVTIGFGYWRDRQHRKALATYMAMRVAIALENFTLRCADAISDNNALFPAPGDEYPQWDRALAAPPDSPEDADGWRALDIKMANRALALHAMHHAEQRELWVSDEWMYGGWLNNYIVASANLGIEAWKIAVSLRNKYAITLDGPPPAASVAEGLEITLARAQSDIATAKALYLDSRAAANNPVQTSQ